MCFARAGDRAGERALAGMSDAAKQETALALSRSIPERTIEGIVLLNQAGQVCWTRRYPEAKAIAEEAAGIFKQLHNLWGYARARRQIGVTVQDLENPKAALPYFQEVIVLTERHTRDLEMQATALASIGWASVYTGEVETALEACSRAVELSRRTGSILGEAWQSNAIGQIYNQAGQPERALTFFERALPLTREAGATMDEGVTLVSMGQVRGRFGNWERSIEYKKQALALTQKGNDRQEEAVALLTIGSDYEALGNSAEALSYYTRAGDSA